MRINEYRKLYIDAGYLPDFTERLLGGLKQSSLYDDCPHMVFLEGLCHNCENAVIDLVTPDSGASKDTDQSAQRPNTDSRELKDMLIIEFGFKEDDIVFGKLLAMLTRYTANKQAKARIDELERVLVTYKNWPGDFEAGIKETIRILKNKKESLS